MSEFKEIRDHISDFGIRPKIDKLVDTGKYDLLPSISKEIEIIETQEDCPEDEDCWKYVLRRVGVDYSTLRQLLVEGKELDELEPNAVVLYFDFKPPEFEFDIAHVGIVAEDKRIDSKWRKGPAIRHPLAYLPTGWGIKYRCFRLPERKKRN